ncbi:MAG: DUF1385 domain-containing protein [Candidatus Latescibacterota bacterium]|nr:MAG: DUF1385 domain-containing protein [Candidatus Latescibacterota bacterium]
MSEKRTSIGGQAVIEGVMMRSPTHYATAVRTPQGRIVIQKTPFKSLIRRFKILNIPIIRGAFTLIETLYIGIQSLTYSASQAVEEDTHKKKGKIGTSLALGGSVVLALGLGLLLFFYVPLMLTEWLGFQSGVVFNLVDGAFRLAVFLLYIVAISRWKEMRRIFQYHGAEHMTIYAFETGEELTAANAKKHSTFHPRCGTSFLIVVMLVSIVVFVFMGKPENMTDRLLRFAMIPLIAGISFEFIKLSAKRRIGKWLKPAIWPGLALQRITTKPPTEDMLEVAIAALEACLDRQAVKLEIPAS